MTRMARILVAFLMLPTLVVDAPMAQAQTPGSPVREKKPKRKLTPVQRFEKAVGAQPKPNPVLPVLMHSLERHLQGAADPSVIDQALQRALRRHPALQRKVLQTWVDNWKAVPSATKAKVVPAELRNLDPARKLDIRMFTNVVQRTALALTPTAAPRPLSSRGVPLAGRAAVPGGAGRRIFIPITPATWIDAFRRPYVDHIEPRTPDLIPLFGPTQSFTIFGRNFSPDRTQNTIRVLRRRRQPDGTVIADVVTTITPSRAAANRLDAVMVSAPPGGYDLAVRVAGIGESNRSEIWITHPPAPRPIIRSVSPQPQYPGRRVLMNGSNFGRAVSIFWESLDYEGAHYYSRPTESRLLSSTQVELAIPQSVLPGHYRIAVQAVPAIGSALEASPLSEWRDLEVRAPQYRVEFTQMTCLDESDPETAPFGVNAYHDELVTYWAISADADVWSKNTGEYGDFDDNEVKNYAGNDRFVFPVEANRSQQVRQALFIGTLLYEWDAGDASAAQAALGFLADLAPEIGAAIGAIYGSPEVGRQVGEIAAKILEAVGVLIVWLGGDPDGLGEKYLTWTALDLQTRTANATGSFSGTLSFLNSNDVGSYRLSYTVRRLEP